jgi:hypothetical protein
LAITINPINKDITKSTTIKRKSKNEKIFEFLSSDFLVVVLVVELVLLIIEPLLIVVVNGLVFVEDVVGISVSVVLVTLVLGLWL